MTASTQLRQYWLGLLARADAAILRQLMANLDPLPQTGLVRGPETGMVMVRGRIGGSGRAFNLGEMTVTRCSVQGCGPGMEGVVGHAMVAGRGEDHAKLAAVADFLLQHPDWHSQVETGVIVPLAERESAALKQRQGEANATKVDFFTLARGEDTTA
jgi:alpha-D-ribose 1-methylphosphonate 5-triphosphate synthase subunit PhnG